MENKNLSPAEVVIRAFGGIRATARALKRDPAAVSRWRKRNRIPSAAQHEILALSSERNLGLSPDDLIIGRSA